MDLLNDLPTTMTLGGKTYEILSLNMTEEEKNKEYYYPEIRGFESLMRAKEMGANFGEIDGEHILEHQEEIPAALRGKVIFIFPRWQKFGLSKATLHFIKWHYNSWYLDWRYVRGFGGRDRVVRRQM